MTHWHYAHSGLLIASNRPLPEWAVFETTPCADADLTIRFYDVPGEAETLTARVTPDECDFFVPEVGHYRVRRSGAIDVWPIPGADRRAVRAFVFGSAFGAFCHLRGLLVLHASVVQVGDAAAAFCGESGAGKSTLAAWLTAQGHSLVSDDLCRVDFPANGPPMAHRSATRLKLWQDALAALNWPSGGLDRDHARMDKFHLPLNNDSTPDLLPLSAIYLPVWGDKLQLTRLSGLTALRRLIGAATYRGDLLEPMGHLGGYWNQCAELLRRVPVWELARPRDSAKLSNSIALVLSHARGRQDAG